jgi:glycosyltransferase involved in cell wall biosynthesis
MQSKKIAYIINHLSFFYSHILPHAIVAKKNGFIIKVFCGNSVSINSEKFAREQLKKHKINFVNCNFNSASLNPTKDIFAFFKILMELRNYRPDIVHITTPKAQILGGICSRILKIKAIVIFISGMGYLFSNDLNYLEKIYKKIFYFIQSAIFRHKKLKIIVENKHDYKYFVNSFSLKKNQISIIKGSGVDLTKFKKVNIKKNKMILLPARVVKEKGIIEFIKASKLLQRYSYDFVVAGPLDYEKSSGFKKEELEELNIYKTVKFIGYQKNIYSILKKTAIVCLPSYREGLPKCLCEAAACGIPIVATKTVGCTEVVKFKFNGELCKVKDYLSLTKKLEKLILKPKLRIKYGNNSINFAKKNFDIKLISIKIIKIYNELLINEK